MERVECVRGRVVLFHQGRLKHGEQFSDMYLQHTFSSADRAGGSKEEAVHSEPCHQAMSNRQEYYTVVHTQDCRPGGECMECWCV